MVRDVHGVDTVLHGQGRVLARDHSLQHDLHRREVAQALHVVPVHRQLDVVLDLREVETVEHPLAAQVARESPVVAGHAGPCVLPRQPELRLAVGAERHIHREQQHSAARSLGVLHERAHHLGVSARIELEPDRLAARGVHLFDPRRGEGGEAQDRALRLRGARHRQLAVGMEGAHAGHGAEEERSRQRLPEDFGGGVDTAHVHQVAGPDLHAVEGLPVGADRAIVVHAGGQIAPVRRRQCATRRLLEVEQVEGVLDRRDRVLGPERRRQRQRQRARREITQQPAAGLESVQAASPRRMLARSAPRR